MMNFNVKTCSDFEKSSKLEWLETNGLGGFACSTVSGANTRRYHGLLTIATRPPLGRVKILSKFEQALRINEKIYELSANVYPYTIYPQGFKYLSSFCLAPFPTWIFEIGNIKLEQKIFMVHGSNKTFCRWSLLSNTKSEISLEIKPLLSYVDYHSLQKRSAEINPEYELDKNHVSVQLVSDMPRIFFTHNANKVNKTGHWYNDFEYPIEKTRGVDFHEDLFQPFSLVFDLSKQAVVVISTKRGDFKDSDELEKAEIERREFLVKTAKAEHDLTKHLVLASDKFIVSRGEGKTIIAGYPWFSDWGRDTMISLNGLALATNREEIAKDILKEFSNHISEGMIPNRFPDEGEIPEYNAVDATLWYFEAVRAYVEKTDNSKFIEKELYEKLVEIIYWYQKGTRFNIHVDDDMLLYAGEKGSQLTWMDAKYSEEVFTPRIGKPVEIQALWYNTLKIMEDFASRFGDEDGKFQYRAMADKAQRSFNKIFWNEEKECLFDVIDKENKDDSVRPNQIFAVSLRYSMLNLFHARKVVQKVEKELFTPLGLRSLSPDEPKYRPTYSGSPYERDSAYHQGIVWAWLMGAFITSLRKVYPKGRKSKEYAGKILESFSDHLTEGGVGQISEIFDADSPHIPRGCFAQAWSVGEILRVLI